MTSEHLRPFLDSDHDMSALSDFANSFARWEVLAEIVEVLCVGRMTALRKLDGGVRGIVVGDMFRRLVSRTLAQQFAKRGEDVTSPHQYVLKTRAGCGCVAHLLQSLMDLDEGATVVFVDGVGAFDLVSRNAMLNGLLKMVDGEQLLPFARLFYSQPSTCLWDDDGTTHRIQQGEGGEHGDALMPFLFSVGTKPCVGRASIDEHPKISLHHGRQESGIEEECAQRRTLAGNGNIVEPQSKGVEETSLRQLEVSSCWGHFWFTSNLCAKSRTCSWTAFQLCPI